jgi:integrase
VERSGLEPFPLYALRHTAVSLLLLEGENPKVVSERLGHSTTRVTLDTYSHVMPGMRRRRRGRWDDSLKEVVPKEEKPPNGCQMGSLPDELMLGG